MNANAFMFSLFMVVVGLLGLYGVGKARESTQEKELITMRTEGIKSYSLLICVGGHPFMSVNSKVRLNFTNQNTIRLDYGTHNEIIESNNLIECSVQTEEQIKNDATFAKTLMWGASALKDKVEVVQFMVLKYKLEGQDINCFFKTQNTINFSTLEEHENIAKISFEINKVISKGKLEPESLR